jgi:hypothetical protein
LQHVGRNNEKERKIKRTGKNRERKEGGNNGAENALDIGTSTLPRT